MTNQASGLYIHIPFCKQACYYCDFHFSTNQSKKGEVVQAIIQEIELQRNYLPSPHLRSIYFGGGTPSLLSGEELRGILRAVRDHFEVEADAEVTLEANPDDLSDRKLSELREAGINRLSIGIQSFHQPHLEFMNRAHNRQEALNCVSQALKAGFSDLSLDLIYGIPLRGEGQENLDPHWVWKEDVAKILALRPNHLSAYCLTIEPQTVFGRWAEQRKLRPIDEELAAQQFEYLLEETGKAGYEQYEISNLCLPGHYSRHNSSYWQGIPYLGVGPSAHSFNGHSRQFNVRNNARYLKALQQGRLPCEQEQLTRQDQINEYLMTALRTKWGIDLDRLKNEWRFDLRKERGGVWKRHLKLGNLYEEGSRAFLTTSGKLLADQITAELMC